MTNCFVSDGGESFQDDVVISTATEMAATLANSGTDAASVIAGLEITPYIATILASRPENVAVATALVSILVRLSCGSVARCCLLTPSLHPIAEALRARCEALPAQ